MDDLAEPFGTLARIRERRDNQKKRLKEECPTVFTEQKHTIEGTTERHYWHYGYMVALSDVLRLFGGDANYLHARFPPHGEGMWVRIDGRSESPDGEEATGLLDNIPIDSPDYHYGQRVNLKKDNKEGWIPA